MIIKYSMQSLREVLLLKKKETDYLSNITNLDIAKLGKDLLTTASNISGRTFFDLVRQEMKEYQERGFSFTISQIEVEDPHEILARKDKRLA